MLSVESDEKQMGVVDAIWHFSPLLVRPQQHSHFGTQYKFRIMRVKKSVWNKTDFELSLAKARHPVALLTKNRFQVLLGDHPIISSSQTHSAPTAHPLEDAASPSTTIISLIPDSFLEHRQPPWILASSAA
ncbi:hypothetical protein PT974_11037 [Cladobotryum mycophilum]|uniref:Uncharacterized protein n=1 Tax=Cladobotryum mycophilum TaxID=491253 RepID=A0ABR0SBF6_9HYPO